MHDLGIAGTDELANPGVNCSIEPMYISTTLRDVFVDRFVEAAKALKLSATLGYSADMGSLITEKQLQKITDHVEDARQKGATVLAGGRPRPEIGPHFYGPTILTNVREGMAAYAEETFGPVVSLYPVKDEDEAIAKANHSDYGLNFSVWTSDGERGRAGRNATASRDRQRQRSMGGRLDVRRPPDGRDEGDRRRPSPRGTRNPEIHRVADHRDGTGAAGRGAAMDTRHLYARVMTTGLRALRRVPGVK